MAGSPDRPAIAVLGGEAALDAAGPAGEFVEDVDGGGRSARPLLMADGMGERRQVEQHGNASAGRRDEVQGVPYERIREPAAVGRVGDDVAGPRSGLGEEVDAAEAEAAMDEVGRNHVIAARRAPC